jgi:hypothetical protein
MRAAEQAAGVEAHALAGDDQHQPETAFDRIGDELRHRLLRRGERHAVQVELGLRRALAPGQGALDLAIEGLRRRWQRPFRPGARGVRRVLGKWWSLGLGPGKGGRGFAVLRPFNGATPTIAALNRSRSLTMGLM